MARSKTQTDLSGSILAGSEEMFDFFCQPCSPDQHLEAVGYCQQCSQYLCINCIRCHSKLAATSHHTVLDKSTMPKTKVQQKVQSTDVLSEKCGKHADKVLEYFCKTHDQICCSVCVTLDHSSCSDKTYVPDISSGIADSQEHRNLRAGLDRLVELIKQRQEHLNDDSKDNEKYYAITLDAIKEFRKQINEILDKIEVDTKQKVSKIHQENDSIIKSMSDKCQSLHSEVKTMAASMDAISKAGKSNQLFVQMKLSHHRKAEIEQQINSKNTITRYTLVTDGKMQHILSALSAIESLSVRQDRTPTRARYLRKVNVKAEDDSGECFISGIAVLDNGLIVITDDDNKAVKLYDMKVNKLTSRLAVPSKPYGITVVKPNQVATALPEEQKIYIITVSDTLSMIQTIEPPDAIFIGLCYNGPNFITPSLNSVKIISMSGETLNTFSTDDKGNQLFTSPECVAINRDKDAVYVTDFETNKVTSMTLSGRVIWVYTHDALKFPSGVAVDKDGAVYVGSRDTHAVHQLTPTGDLTRIILGLDQGLAKWPRAIAFGDEDDILCISSVSSKPALRNYIRLYQLE